MPSEPRSDAAPPAGGSIETGAASERADEPEAVTYIGAITRALEEALEEDPTVVLVGQDIAAHGGAFKATQGFLERFGRDRVLNTPIAESGAIGMAIGAALVGDRPVVEMQFADFVTCGFNEVVNVAAKFRYRTGLSVPIVIRLPYGGGVGAGPFHSQSPEAWFLHVAGLKVVAPSNPADAWRLLRASIRDPDPVLFFEHKRLYRRSRAALDSSPPAADRVVGEARVARSGTDVTAVAWGAVVELVLEAAERLAGAGVDVEVIDVPVLAPLDLGRVVESLARTGKVAVVHEAPRTGGFGGEIAARIAEESFELLDGPVTRIAAEDRPIPFHPALEARTLPSVDRIAEGLRRLARY